MEYRVERRQVWVAVAIVCCLLSLIPVSISSAQTPDPDDAAQVEMMEVTSEVPEIPLDWEVVDEERSVEVDSRSGAQVTTTVTTYRDPVRHFDEAACDESADLPAGTEAVTCSDYYYNHTVVAEQRIDHLGYYLIQKVQTEYLRYDYNVSGIVYPGYWITRVSTWWERSSSNFFVSEGKVKPTLNGWDCNNNHADNSITSNVGVPTWSGNRTLTYYTTTPYNWGVRSRAEITLQKQDVEGYSKVQYGQVWYTQPIFTFPY